MGELDEASDERYELDELADADEEGAENILGSDEATVCLIKPYDPPAGYTIVTHVESVGNHLKGRQIAYKFESGWELGSFKGMYTGKKDMYKGFSRFYLNRKSQYYVDLQIENHGVDKDWVLLNKD